MAYAPATAPRPAAYQPNVAPANPSASTGAPPGTFAPGTKVQVGNHRVVIDRYLSEGGFAHVYVVRVPRSSGGTELAVLKRVAVPDKETLANMRTEVETMKKLKGHRHIVTYLDSHASQLKGGGYEVFLLMEFCAGGGLIDFMNTRLKNRLTEPEILNIFGDVAEGVASMHYLKPPLLHRDLKVENVLIATGSPSSGTSKLYKVCDFGSAAPPRPAATSTSEGRLIEEDVQRHTTLQYRSPEMIDVYRNRPIDEKSDIWALGVLLYKLCYYTTPFEADGQMAILTANFKYPAYPPFSDRLKKLIAFTLAEDPKRRPNIYQVICEVSTMRGKPVPVKDIYTDRTASEARRNQQLPDPPGQTKTKPVIGVSHEAAQKRAAEKIPEIVPMRRGRPGAPTTNSKASEQTSSTDPFAALDSKNYATRVAAVEQLSAKFPTVEDFSLLQDRGQKFQFSNSSKTKAADDLNQRVTNALADEAFASLSPPRREEPRPIPKPSSAVAEAAISRNPRSPLRENNKAPERQNLQSPPVSEPIAIPQEKKPMMVSTGTMTSNPPSPHELKSALPSEKPVWKVPASSDRSTLGILSRSFSRSPNPSKRQILTSQRTSGEILDSSQAIPPSRASFDTSRPAMLEVASSTHRSRSVHDASRGGVDSEGSLEADRHRSSPFHHIRTKSQTLLLGSKTAPKAEPRLSSEDANIVSDVDYLRAKEQEDSQKGHIHLPHHRRTTSLHKSRTSSGTVSKSVSGARQILGSRFGDAFRRFESSGSSGSHRNSSPNDAAGVAGAEAEDESLARGRLVGDEIDASVDSPLDETVDLSPEMRRELERRQLSQEERRVEEAAAAYRRQVSNPGAPSGLGRGPGSRVNKASAIQDRVKNLLDESGKSSPLKRTAEGYGRYTDTYADSDGTPSPAADGEKPPLSRIPTETTPVNLPIRMISGSARPETGMTSGRGGLMSAASVQQHTVTGPAQLGHMAVAARPMAATVTATAVGSGIGPRPSAPPKPVALRTGGPGPSPSAYADGTNGSSRFEQSAEVGAGAGDDWESSFSKRYPSLSIEMVETEIAAGGGGASVRGEGVGGAGGAERTRPLRVKDV